MLATILVQNILALGAILCVAYAVGVAITDGKRP